MVVVGAKNVIWAELDLCLRLKFKISDQIGYAENLNLGELTQEVDIL